MDSGSIKQSYDLLDLTKFILSMIIIAIHSSLFTMYLYPWLRIAIPLFFTISSYLFFSKIRKCESNQAKTEGLKKFVWKNLRLWIIWSLILLPIVLFIRRGYYDDGFIGFVMFIKSILFGDTFVGGWFIIALVEGVAIVYFLSRKIKAPFLLIISLLLNLIAVVDSSYIHLISKGSIVFKAFKAFGYYVTSPDCSVFSGMLWIAVGKLFADGNIKIRMKWSVLITLISAAGLYVEWRMLYNLTGLHRNDCYAFLIPLCISLFGIIEHFKAVRIPNAMLLRKASIIIYVTHGAAITVISFLLKQIFENANSLIVFLLVLAACICLTLIINRLEKRFKWMKNLY